MSPGLWRQVDFQEEPGRSARLALLEAAPHFFERADPNLLDCLRSYIKTTVEMMVMKHRFTEAVQTQLDPAMETIYRWVLSTEFRNKEFPAAVQVIKWWQLGLYLGEKSRANVGPKKLPSEEWMEIFSPSLERITQADPVLTDPDASKTLGQLVPKLMTERIDGLEAIIDTLLKVTAAVFTNNANTFSYLMRAIKWEELRIYGRSMKETLGEAASYPDILATVLSAQYQLCKAKLLEEGEVVTQNLCLRFAYKDGP